MKLNPANSGGIGLVMATSEARLAERGLIPLSRYDCDYKVSFTAYSFPWLEPRKLFVVELEKGETAITRKQGVCLEAPEVILDFVAAFRAGKRDDVATIMHSLHSLVGVVMSG